MDQKTEKLAILFADISGSTALYETLGDSLARQMVGRCIAVMAGELAAHRGTLVKTIGDEIMCIFPSAEDAMRSACSMQLAVENGKPGGDRPMFIRIGFHYGDVICESGDVYGDAVNIAARVTSVTRARQILATEAVVNALPHELKDKTNYIRRDTVKGKQEHIDFFQVIWEPEDMERTRIGIPAYRKPQESNEEMILRYHDQTLTINEQHKSGMLGRGGVCDMVVHNDFASRQHARVEARFGKFVISDQSTNGTYIRFNDRHVTHIVNEETMLRGSGSISLGQTYSDNPTELIEFSIVFTPVKA